MKTYHVYILASFHRVLYIGITSDLRNRLDYHRNLVNPNSFTARYAVTRLATERLAARKEDRVGREDESALGGSDRLSH